jgi:soluble lytic murein transglycosylase
MIRAMTRTAIFSILVVSAPAATANSSDDFRLGQGASTVSVMSSQDRDMGRAAFQAIRAGRWDDAAQLINAMPDGPLKAIALSELFTAPGSPVVSGDQLQSLLNDAPWLPKADQLGTMARKRGATALPSAPETQRFVWLGGAPKRGNPKNINDAGTNSLRSRAIDRIKDDNPAGAEALVEAGSGQVSEEGLTELRQRVAWSYYIENDNAAAQRVAGVARVGSGPWAAQADWTYGLSSWRLGDYAAAEQAFSSAAMRSNEPEAIAAGHYWAARSAMAMGQPDKVQGALQTAAQYHETFYGLLAAEALGMEPLARKEARARNIGVKEMREDGQIALVLGLAEVDQVDLADETLRHFARTGNPTDYHKYMATARELGLPQTQLWLAHNGPQGTRPDTFARYPAPRWAPEGGWRVDKALVYGHALQESRFQASAVSPVGARGLLQVRPGTAGDMARARGANFVASDLDRPSVNLEYGQSYMEFLRDRGETGGYLPQVIAAYNAGPAPIGRWQTEIDDRGDPLLYIESIPYWETREYVGTVIRNYWIYEAQEKPDSASKAGLAQNMWPRYPGQSGDNAVRLMHGKAQDRYAHR